MIALLRIIASFFVSGGGIARLLAFIGAKLVSKPLIISAQLTAIGILVVARVAFLVAVLDFARLCVQYAKEFNDKLSTVFDSDSAMALAFEVLRSVGVIDGFLDAFSIFKVLFPALLLSWALKFAFKTAEITSNELFKLGVLTQQ